MANERSYFDKKMIEMFNPNDNYHVPPWPTPRSQFDKELQQKWCPKCDNTPNSYINVENYVNHLNFRTKFDQELQQKWCPKCEPKNNKYCVKN